MYKLEENKREMFDGMRAYHQSEISHANMAITMLLAISGGVGAVIIAILFPDKPPLNATSIGWSVFAFSLIFSLVVTIFAHVKINGDHEIYKNFGMEYVKTCMLLGYYDTEVEFDKKNEQGEFVQVKEKLKLSREIGQGNGYKRTQKIILSYFAVLNIGTLVFALYLTYSH